jgi:NAD(P)-dependent dehydrogenase (short-subunit alcohol dehydrogenase family)
MAMKEFGPVLVTGASTGIGRATVERLAKNGHLVYATARKESDMVTLGQIENVDPIRIDVTKPASVEKAAEIVKKRGKGLYGLVNNAGIGDLWPLGELDDEDLRRIFEVNVFGVHRVTRAMLPFLMEARGRIVNIGSIGGLMSFSMRGAYCMTKFSIEAYSEALHQELERHGVRVSVIEPTYYRTSANASATKLVRDRAASAKPTMMKAEVDELLKSLPGITENWQKRDTPEKVAKVVLEALTSESPRLRYVASPNKEQSVQPLEALISKAIGINVSNESPLSRSQMHSLLDRMWGIER